MEKVGVKFQNSLMEELRIKLKTGLECFLLQKFTILIINHYVLFWLPKMLKNERDNFNG